MTIPLSGAIASVDLTVPNADDIRDFYQRVMGWNYLRVEMGDYADYMMTAPDDQPASGICHKQGVNAAQPSVWMVYFIVDNMDASLQAVERLGGKVVVRPESSEGTRYAVIQDPAGAVCALYEVSEADQEGMAAQLAGIEAARKEPGHLTWVDLTVDDAEGVRDFYQQVIGWTAQEVPMEGYSDYNMCSSEGTVRAGICHKRAMNAKIPSHWMPYFVMPDIGASQKAVEAGGGKVISTLQGHDGGKLIVIEDPAGAVCSLVSGG